MKLATPSSKKKYIIAVVVALVVVGIAGAGVYAMQAAQQKNSEAAEKNTSRTNPDVNDRSVNYEKPTDAEIKAGEDIKKDSAATDPPKDSGSTGGSASQPAGDLNVQASASDGTVAIRTTITGNVTGSCKLTLSKDDKTVTKEAVGIQPMSSYSTCKGWFIPNSELSKGTWTAKVEATYSSKTVNATATVTVP